MLVRWVLTVLSEMNSSAAISWLVRPLAMAADDLGLPFGQRRAAGRAAGRRAPASGAAAAAAVTDGEIRRVAGVRGPDGLDEQRRAGVLEQEADRARRAAPRRRTRRGRRW